MARSGPGPLADQPGISRSNAVYRSLYFLKAGINESGRYHLTVKLFKYNCRNLVIIKLILEKSLKKSSLVFKKKFFDFGSQNYAK